MSNKIIICHIVLLVFILLNIDLRSQTTEWKVVWDKNSELDSVDHYVIYRNAGSVPSLNDSIGSQVHPTEFNIDSVVYVDQNILVGVEYYYKVQAVDYIGRRSNLSQNVNAAIPKILINDNITFTINSEISWDLNQSLYVEDPDNAYSQLEWDVTGGEEISITINSSNIATVITPQDSTATEVFVFSVTDPYGFYDSKQVTVSLTSELNNPPVILSSPVKTAIAGQLYEYDVTAEDPNGDPLSFTLIESPPFLNLTVINNSVAKIVGTPALNDVGDHLISVRVEDGRNGSDIQEYTLTVMKTETELRVFPIPYNVNTPNSYGGIYFDLPDETESYTVLIYNILGDLVFRESQLSNYYIWKIENSSGKEVNAGLYIYYVKSSDGSQVASGKLVIIR
jgi:hypothetical protein